MRGKVTKSYFNFKPVYLKKILNIKRQSATWDTSGSINKFEEFLGYVIFYFIS